MGIGSSALRDAAASGDVAGVEKALASGAEKVDAVFEENHTALTLAASKGHAKVVSLLVNRGANIEHACDNGFTALICAVDNNHLEAATELADLGANLEAADQFRKTALIHAAFRNFLDIVAVLLKRGANINAKDHKNSTPLSHACLRGHFLMARALVLSGADATTNDTDGYTCLMHAVCSGHFGLVNLIAVEGHAPLDAATKEGETALHFAASRGSVNVVRFLLDRGIDTEREDVRGWNAARVACLNKHRNIELMIQTHHRARAARVKGKAAAASARLQEEDDDDDDNNIKQTPVRVDGGDQKNQQRHDISDETTLYEDVSALGRAQQSSREIKKSVSMTNPLPPLSPDDLHEPLLRAVGGSEHHVSIDVKASPQSSNKSSP